ncbi:hypothetical protein GCM10022291_03630 [Postechiella marina]|uniref:DNA polymerase III subunit gamma/tau n=1 Tax=Postechiella marina TaxID=943941 RepID=A0ABP8C085_9FLAO
MDVVVEEENLPTEDFDPEDLIAHWHKFTEILIEQGKHNLASILSMAVPKVKGTTIHLEYPNETNKVELERQQYDLMNYLRKSVNNYNVNLSITINEVLEKQYAYTTADKFEMLKEKNPNLELLRRTFDLDVL